MAASPDEDGKSVKVAYFPDRSVAGSFTGDDLTAQDLEGPASKEAASAPAHDVNDAVAQRLWSDPLRPARRDRAEADRRRRRARRCTVDGPDRPLSDCAYDEVVQGRRGALPKQTLETGEGEPRRARRALDPQVEPP